jgi:hypothetical protein
MKSSRSTGFAFSSSLLQTSGNIRSEKPLNNLSACRHLTNTLARLLLALILTNGHLNLLSLTFVALSILSAFVALSSSPRRSLSQEHSIVACIVLNIKVCASFDESLNALKVRVKRSPVQRRVTRVVAVVNKRSALGSIRG